MGKQKGGSKGTSVRKAGITHKTSASSKKGSRKVDPLLALAKGARIAGRFQSAMNIVRPIAVQAGLKGEAAPTAATLQAPAWAVQALGANLAEVLEAGYKAGIKAEEVRIALRKQSEALPTLAKAAAAVVAEGVASL